MHHSNPSHQQHFVTATCSSKQATAFSSKFAPVNWTREKRNCLLTFVLLLAGLLGTMANAEAAPANEPASREDGLRVMSFNVRYGLAKDGENAWENRRDFVTKLIKTSQPDLVGTQETLPFQAKFLKENLPAFDYAGRSREDNDGGEQCGILFRRERFVKLEEGHFWLSENPAQPGSQSWDAALPRMATWLKLWDRKNERPIIVLNTHFDHRGEVARQQSAGVIRDFVDRLPADLPLVVLGDFNAAVGSKPYLELFEVSQKQPPRRKLHDTFRVVHPKPTDREGTFNGFKGTETGGRIDWIGVSDQWRVVTATIERTSYDGRFPSDHFPVLADIELARPKVPDDEF